MIKERRRNRLKDFVQVAGQLGVSHFMIFSQTASGTNLRICRTPHGPTLIFRVHHYSLMKDVAAAQIRPRSHGQEFQQPPLVRYFYKITYFDIYILIVWHLLFVVGVEQF